MSPIPRETTWGEVRVHHWMHSPSNAFITVYACHFVKVLLVTAVSPALALLARTRRHSESPRCAAQLPCGRSPVPLPG